MSPASSAFYLVALVDAMPLVARSVTEREKPTSQEGTRRIVVWRRDIEQNTDIGMNGLPREVLLLCVSLTLRFPTGECVVPRSKVGHPTGWGWGAGGVGNQQ